MAVSKGIREALTRNYGNTQMGTAHWLSALPKRRQEAFVETVTLFLKSRAAGTTDMSLTVFKNLVLEEFGYPFKRDTLRSYMEKEYHELYRKQARGF